jgi:signal transduction histidine kinase
MRELLTSVHDELVRLSAIVESLMILIKTESGRLAFQFTEVSLDAMVRELADDALVLASKKKIKVELLEVEPVMIRCDAARLRQLFLNLIENAIKYTPPRGSITLALKVGNGNADVSIGDTGIGIPKKDLHRVFDRFYRVKSDGSGSGLGLAIAKWIAEAHDGTIKVESRERKGSTFTVTFPLSPKSR